MFLLPSSGTQHHGWAARNLFLFGSLALAAISLSTLHMETAPEKSQSAGDQTVSA
jgi:hypothetical protein